MMSFTYTLKEAERWAAFSGDYNPIHFDTAEAKMSGMQGICVHGMRAMLDVKTALSQKANTDALSAEYLQFTCRLRGPVLCGIPYQLSVNETSVSGGIQLCGKLRNSRTHSTSISSKLHAINAQELLSTNQVNIVPCTEIAALYDPFQTVGGPVSPLWNFYDALLFRLLVNAPETLQSVQRVFSTLHAGSLNEIFSRVQVVQTHHQTIFPRYMLHQAAEKRWLEPLQYAIQPTLIIGEKTSGSVLVAGIQAWHANEMPIFVGMTLKTGSLAV